MAQQRDDSQVTPRIRRARVATFCGFALVGALMYIWSTSVTAFRNHLGLSGAEGDLSFGLIAFGIGAGAAVGSLFIGRLIDLYGAKRIVGMTLVLYPLSIVPLGLVGNVPFALAFGIALGLLRGAADTALNAHGVQVERFYRRPIMSAFHAFYSLGGFLFGMVGSYFAGRSAESALLPFMACGLALLAASVVICRYLLDKDDMPAPQHAPHALQGTPATATHGHIVLLMVGFGVLLLGAMVGENAVADWGQEYLSREVGTTASVAGMAISFFTGAQFIGRLVGDRLAEWMGAPRLVCLSGLCAVLGLIVTITGTNAVAGMIGFSMFGLGVSCIAPLMLSSAGRKDPLNAGRNIGIVNGIGYTGMLAAPAALSLIVSAFGIGMLLYFPLVLLALLALFGPQLMRDRRPSTATPAVRSAL
ncbi:MAG: Inner membrane protein YbjJ [Paracidovorax wautersii]|uniref:Inner membrane protein YbjJ n=1 Tax=Paracidovorax wautersii TaxID=1177982 RepID=A0A7V8FKV5_9BURK|nr:MAG: Inner membrane protein YbjJ [Paracidovorax wautersii]